MKKNHTENKWDVIAADKDKPTAIWHDGDARAYYEATEDERAAWNVYAQNEADAFNNDPHRDTYDSTAVFPGRNRDGKTTFWCPPVFFPEWLANRRKQ